MGAKIPGSVLLGARSRISDPWFLEVGENVTIGADAVILGHLGHGKEIILGRVEIGEGAIVGMRAVIFPPKLDAASTQIVRSALKMSLNRLIAACVLRNTLECSSMARIPEKDRIANVAFTHK